MTSQLLSSRTTARGLPFLLCLALVSPLLSPMAAFADDDGDDDDHGGRSRSGARGAVNATYQTECSASCHVAFPAKMLPASAWREIMGGLNKHFGTNATLDAAQHKEILNYLEANAGRRAARTPDGQDTLRITKTRWFIHEHDEVANRVWSYPSVKSPANCAACHTKADEGSYRERDIRTPRQ